MYRGRLERDLGLWVEKGLIARPVADGLLKELDSRESSFSVGQFLVILAAVLISAAILMLVASNWEAIPRLVRVGTLVGLIWVFHGAAALLLARGRNGLAAASLIMGTMTFGGAMSLIGQMYHLSGDASDMMMAWFAAAAFSAAAFRSGALAAITGFLAWGYFISLGSDFDFDWNLLPALVVPAMALGVMGLVYYTKAGKVRHPAYLLMLAWLVWYYVSHDSVPTAILLAIVGAVGFLLSGLPQSPLYPAAKRAGAAPAFYTCLLCMIGLGLLHIEYDESMGRLVVGVLTMIAAVTSIAVCGRDNGVVRYLGYIAFAGEILYLSSMTVGSIIGTSGLFLVSGLVVGFTAWAVIQLEKRLAGRAAEVKA